MRQSSSSAAQTPARILMVDDNRMGLSARKSVLEELGYKITTAAGPQEALDHLVRLKFDLVISDYKLPGMNGAEFIKKVRKHEPSTPVILISGFVDALGLDEKNTGADMVIQKSANEVAHMVRSVKSLLRTAKKPAASHKAQPPKAKRHNA